jgi:hypothetical protein
MEPSSTPSRRAGALLTIIAVMSLVPSGPAAARGFAGMGRAQAIHVVPRAAVHLPIVHRPLVNPRLVAAPGNALIHHRLHRRLFGGAAVGLSGPYGYPYAIDAGQPPDSALAAADIEPGLVPYDRPACVRPLVIRIKPAPQATDWPRVIYGRPPPAC